jgi:hypothetical protein
MDNVNLNPVYIVFLYILRCLIPLGIMLGISYLLRRFGLIKPPPPPPPGWDGESNHSDGNHGGLAHG